MVNYPCSSTLGFFNDGNKCWFNHCWNPTAFRLPLNRVCWKSRKTVDWLFKKNDDNFLLSSFLQSFWLTILSSIRTSALSHIHCCWRYTSLTTNKVLYCLSFRLFRLVPFLISRSMVFKFLLTYFSCFFDGFPDFFTSRSPFFSYL